MDASLKSIAYNLKKLWRIIRKAQGLFCMALALYRRNKHSFKNISLYLYQFLIQLYNTSYKYYKYPLEYRHLLLMGL